MTYNPKVEFNALYEQYHKQTGEEKKREILGEMWKILYKVLPKMATSFHLEFSSVKDIAEDRLFASINNPEHENFWGFTIIGIKFGCKTQRIWLTSTKRRPDSYIEPNTSSHSVFRTSAAYEFILEDAELLSGSENPAPQRILDEVTPEPRDLGLHHMEEEEYIDNMIERLRERVKARHGRSRHVSPTLELLLKGTHSQEEIGKETGAAIPRNNIGIIHRILLELMEEEQKAPQPKTCERARPQYTTLELRRMLYREIPEELRDKYSVSMPRFPRAVLEGAGLRKPSDISPPATGPSRF